jgi:hypothetical protein
VASGQRISVKTADSVGSQATLISLECIAQSNVVDDGIADHDGHDGHEPAHRRGDRDGVWQDATAGDFTTRAASASRSTSRTSRQAAGGHMISGTNAGTTTFGALT